MAVNDVPRTEPPRAHRHLGHADLLREGVDGARWGE